jgi:FKBP-type peptidyl-prolyl cis-trans isomerase
MKAFQYSWLACALFLLAGCGSGNQDTEENSPEPEQRTPATKPDPATSGPVEIEPGLTMRVLNEGGGKTAQPGQTAVVHYTGWLYDAAAPDNRGQKFDSSVDRGQHFEFPLGAGAVIAGWDRGVAGMRVGEVRELTIAPELAYGERGAGTVIPPGATLVFEVELADVVGPDASGTE